ncbi:MAG: hypothetical protein ACLP5H_32315 [Desulfomonilaceae bacterium]
MAKIRVSYLGISVKSHDALSFFQIIRSLGGSYERYALVKGVLKMPSYFPLGIGALLGGQH